MSINVTIDGLDTEIDVSLVPSATDINPESYVALRGLKGDKGDDGVVGRDGTDGQDGVGIASITQNQDGTLSINLDDGTSYVTEPLKGADGYTPIKGVDYFDGAKGETGATGATGATGNGIASAVLNSDYTLTLSFTDGTSYTTPSIRGEKGEQGDAGEVDTAMSGTSILPVQNKVIKAYVDNGLSVKADASSVPRKVSDLTNDSGFINGNVGGMFYGTCSTAAGTVAKVVECADFAADNLKAGAIIIVTFTATNSGAVANLTMNVNGTGAKHIKYINNGSLGNLSSAGYLKANTEYPFYYDGTNWVVWFNVSTTYSALSEADMHTGTATTGRLITAQRLKQAVQYHAPVKSVNGSTGAVTISVPTKTSELANDGDSVNPFVTSDMLTAYASKTELDEWIANPQFIATDATSKAVLLQAFGVDANIRTPSSYTSQLLLLCDLEPRTWFCWMNGTELEFARMSVSVNTSNSAITLYLRGRTSIATGIMGMDSSWTISQLASDAEGVAY